MGIERVEWECRGIVSRVIERGRERERTTRRGRREREKRGWALCAHQCHFRITLL